MSIQRLRPGVYIELMAKAKERILPKSGIVCIPYVGEYGKPNEPVLVSGYEERMKETLGLIDSIELAAESGPTLLLYRICDSAAQTAKFTQANSFEISAKYPGLEGNKLSITVQNSTAEPGKKEVVIKHTELGFTHKLSVAGVDELVEKTANLDYVAQAKKLGNDAIADVVATTFAGGTTGKPASLTSTHFTKLFSDINGADFDALYLPSADAAIQASAKQFVSDRRTQSQKLSTLVIGGSSNTDVDMEKHIERSVAMNERYIVNSAISGLHVNGKTYSSLEFAAWVAGLIAATPAHISLTALPIPLKKATKDFGQSEIMKGLANGVLMATRDGYSYIIESAVNTLSVLHTGEREDFGKIRVSMTLDQVMNDLVSVGKKYKGKLSNNDIGRATFIAAAKSYLDERVRQSALAAGANVTESPDLESFGDTAYFRVSAQPLDAIEVFTIGWEVL
ncbi:phage tail sheath subtilisin-like domain-containing protein [Brevibacillus sp. SYSU BS000544]|uniref:phage tail sheath subtilisin-like domain-containing protein n=1 Tax=Brevibacillus sp. SYSU BS000544 TaxID=3416443 RepID=UPI003CE5A9FA